MRKRDEPLLKQAGKSRLLEKHIERLPKGIAATQTVKTIYILQSNIFETLLSTMAYCYSEFRADSCPSRDEMHTHTHIQTQSANEFSFSIAVGRKVFVSMITFLTSLKIIVSCESILTNTDNTQTQSINLNTFDTLIVTTNRTHIHVLFFIYFIIIILLYLAICKICPLYFRSWNFVLQYLFMSSLCLSPSQAPFLYDFDFVFLQVWPVSYTKKKKKNINDKKKMTKEEVPHEVPRPCMLSGSCIRTHSLHVTCFSIILACESAMITNDCVYGLISDEYL